MKADFDLVVRAGTVADGSGRTFEADVAVRDGVIREVGTVRGRGEREIDAHGLLVTPGFVDVHSHYDGQATWDHQLAPSSWHGVTTTVMGNCGVGFAPVRAQDRERLVELMEGVEDIPGVTLHEGLRWNWETFPDYLDTLEAMPRDMDLCAQLPHAALRVYVMGERAVALEDATTDDIAQMRRITAEAMRAGAIGFTTSRTLNHRTLKGAPTPSLRATEAELTGIALGLKDAGSGVLEMISDWNTPDVVTEFAMVRRVVEASGRPLSLSLGQRHSKPEGWRRLLALVDEAVDAGLEMRAQVAPRPIGLIFGLAGSRHPFSATPAFLEIAALEVAQKAQRMRDPAFRARVLQEADSQSRDPSSFLLMAFDRIFPLNDPPNYEPDRSESLAEQAAVRGITPAELAYELLMQQDGRQLLFSPFANYAHYNLDACGEMLGARNTIPGLGDGGAHVAVISDGSFPTYLLTHWGRDRSHGRHDLGYLVKRQTLDTARAVGLHDRGLLAPGMKADINVIDFDRLAVCLPEMVWDLPAGGKRLLQRARGYVHTFVSGVETYREGEATGALPGRLVRQRASQAAGSGSTRETASSPSGPTA